MKCPEKINTDKVDCIRNNVLGKRCSQRLEENIYSTYHRQKVNNIPTIKNEVSRDQKPDMKIGKINEQINSHIKI